MGLLGVLAVGCMPTSHPRLSFAVEQRLLRETTLDDMPEGQAEEGDGIVRVYHSGHNGRGTGVCSGALIDSRHVLTAAHCIVETDGNQELTAHQTQAGAIHVELGGGYLPWGRVGVVHMRICDGYIGDLQHDLAVLVLSRPVPPDVPTFTLGYDMPQDTATVFEIGGFGSDAAPRVMPDTRWPVTSVHRHVFRGPVLHHNDDVVLVNIPGRPGDSGGPIVDTSTGRIVSVVSRGHTGEDLDEPGGASKNAVASAKKKAAVGKGKGDDVNEALKKIPLVGGPRLYTCKKSIDQTLAR